MPQMMPMNWIFLFFYFFCLVIIFNINMFFSNNLTPSSKNFSLKNNPQNWLW
uniref:ATP synthase F0 subunit 8 n=1 Tax=Oxyethira ecornuta TaxID=1401674 RepID=UPI0022DCD899|nr:ATP synthase F0 subunit 8 [Oxyethira ecornuta]UZZ44237.1 ATP synthase F0 subunit 8 [Oxyethira ecornuta]